MATTPTTARRQLRAIVFDLDDTLLDHHGAACQALDACTDSWGRQGAAADLETEWFSLERTFYARFQRGELTIHEQRRERIRAFLGQPDLADRYADELFADYWAAYEAAWRPFPDAIPAIDSLRELGVDIAVLTNGRADDQRRKVCVTGLGIAPERVFPSSELPAAKPDRRAFDSVLRALAVDADEVLMVGDVMEIDVLGALHAGWWAVLIDRSAPGSARSSFAPVIPSLDHLAQVVPAWAVPR